MTALPRFLRYLQTERRLSEHTSKAYLRDLQQFADYRTAQGVDDWPDVDAALLRRYISKRFQQGLAGRSIQRQLSAIRSFYNFLMREALVKVNPAEGIRAPRSPRKLPSVLDVDQVQTVLEQPTASAEDIRDLAIMELIYSSGLRLSELVQLDLGHIDTKATSVRLHGKGNKTRIVPLGKQALLALANWLQIRQQWVPAEEQALFVSRRGARIAPRTVQSRLSLWAKKSANGQHLHPHRLRHSFASHMLESSGEIRAVQELLGHSSLSTTQIYTHLNFQHLAEVYDKAHPRAKKRRKTGK